MVIKIHFQRIRLNKGGYDSGGTYYGVGQPVYRYESECGTETGTLRADGRDHAKLKIRSRIPNVIFPRRYS